VTYYSRWHWWHLSHWLDWLTGLHWWNFWSRLNGTLYGIRAHHPENYNRPIFAYGGKTFQQPWTKRIEEHLWGRHYGNTPHAWVDTVYGYHPNGDVTDVIAAGGAYIIWHGRCSPFGLWWREILMIWTKRPYYNSIWNTGNRRRIVKSVAVAQRAARDMGLASSGANVVRRTLSGAYLVKWFLLAAVLTLFIPGLPGWDYAAPAVGWIVDHRGDLGAFLILAAGARFVTTLKPRRRRRKSSTRTRSSSKRRTPLL
jgi:hypothetical protein